jgi:hypothetical protein
MSGPGTELRNLLAELGIRAQNACGCKSMAEKMDRLGPERCRHNQRHIVAYLKRRARKSGWLTKLTAARAAFERGIAFQVNWLDPIPGLVALAIDRAEAA